MSSEVWTGCIANVHHQEQIPVSPSTVSTSFLCLLCPPLPHWYHVAFFYTGWPVLWKSWWQQLQQQVQHLRQQSTTHCLWQLQQQQWWQPSMPNLQREHTEVRQYGFTSVASHHYGWGSPWIYDASKWWPSAFQMNTQTPYCQSVATASTRSRLYFVK